MIDFILRGLFYASRFRTYLLKRPGPEELLRRPKRILLTRLQNVGDMIVFLPTIRAFRRAYPEAEIRLLVKHPGGIVIVEDCPDLDGLIRVDGKGFSNKIRLIREIRKFRPDLFVISTQDYGRVPWGVMGGAKVLVGYKKVLLGKAWKREKLPSILYRSPPFVPEETEVLRNLKLAKICGISHADPVPHYNWFTQADQAAVDRLLEKGQTDQVRVALSPGSKRPTRWWMEDRFAQTADQLIDRYHGQIYWIGGPEEVSMIERIQQLMKGESFSLAGRTSLKQVGPLLKKMDLLVTVDSGPMHIAAAVGIPFVALFGPGEYKKWRHDSDPSRQRNLYTGAECAPCYRMECADQRCMEGITVSAVLQEVDAILKSSNVNSMSGEVQ